MPLALAADDEFQRSNIRAFPEADPLGCLGDQGWYCICAALWAFNCEPPEMVWAHPGERCARMCHQDIDALAEASLTFSCSMLRCTQPMLCDELSCNCCP